MTAAAEPGWTEDQKAAIRELLEPRLSPLSKPPQVSDPGVEYCRLLSAEGLGQGVWYREGKTHQFVVELSNPDENTLNKVYRTQVKLQGRYPLVSLDFQLQFWPMSAQKKDEMKAQGYRFVTPRSSGARGR